MILNVFHGSLYELKEASTLNYKKHMYSTSKNIAICGRENEIMEKCFVLMGDVNNNTVSFYKPIKFSRKAFTFGKIL